MFIEGSSGEQRRVQETLIVSLVSVAGSLLGIVKNSFLAARFGAGIDLDLYFAAFRVPDFLYGIFIFSALSSAFLPVFSQLILQGKERVWQFLSNLLLIFSLVLSICAGFVFLFSERVASILAPGFSYYELMRLAALLRILMIQPIFLAISNLVAITLQGFKRFFVSSLAPVFYNTGIIIGVVLFGRFWGIYGVAWGVILGALLHLFVQLPTLLRLGFRPLLGMRVIFPQLKEMFVLMLPRSLAISVNNLLLFWITVVATLLPVGSLAVYNFSDSLQTFPQTVFALAFITTSFPYLAQSWAIFEQTKDQEEKKRFENLFRKVSQEILLVMVPISFLLAVFAPAVVRLLFGYGAFDSKDQHLAVITLIMFCLGIPAQSLVMFFVRVFFAMRDTKSPLFTVFFVGTVLVLLIWFLSKYLGVYGIALAMSFGAWLNTVILLFILRKRLSGLLFSFFWQWLGRGAVLGIIGALPGGLLYYTLEILVKNDTYTFFLFKSFISGVSSLIALVVAIFVFRLVDIKQIFCLDKYHLRNFGQRSYV